jgi:hypothetical protein
MLIDAMQDEGKQASRAFSFDRIVFNRGPVTDISIPIGSPFLNSD